MNPRARRLRRQRRSERSWAHWRSKLGMRGTFSTGNVFPATQDALAGILANFAKFDAETKAAQAELKAFIAARIRESLSGSVCAPNANTEATRQAVREHVASFLASLPERPACSFTGMVFDEKAGTITTHVSIPTWMLEGRIVPAEET